MRRLHTTARIAQGHDAEIKADPFGYARRIARPVDCTDAEQFPEIARARAHARKLMEAGR